MDLSIVFTICNLGVMPFWALLILAPRAAITDRLVHSAVVPALLGVVYAVGVVLSPGAPEGAGFGSLEAVGLLFQSPHGVLVGWVHYLAFDLFVGAWEGRDARRRGLPHFAVAVCQVFTLMLGPLGLLLYLALRAAMQRVGTLEEGAA